MNALSGGERRTAAHAGALLCGLAAGAGLGFAQATMGPWPAIVCIAVAVVAAVLWRPGAAVAALLVVVALAEQDSQAMFGETNRLYRSVAGLPISPVLGFLAFIAVGAVMALRRDNVAALVPGRFTPPLVLLAVAAVPAALTGRAAGADPVSMLFELVGLGTLILVPVVVAWSVRTSLGVRTAVPFVGGLAMAKTVEGLASWALGAGRPLDSTTITFYEPTPLWLLTLFVIGVVVALVSRVPLRWWVVVGAGLAMACLVLSLRRGFWVAATVGIVLSVLVATGRSGRALLVPAVLVVAVALTVALRSGGATDSRNVALERARSVAPTRLTADSEDRYRLEEQANVRKEISRRPLTGIGLAVPWQARVPLSIEHEGGRLYTHFVVLWYWLKLGLVGAIGYVWLIVAAVRTGLAVWRRHPDELVRVAGLASAAGFVSLAVVESTASFTGVSPRFTIAAGAVIGWLAAASTSSLADPSASVLARERVVV